MYELGGETTFGSSYREVRKTEGSRNRDSTVGSITSHCSGKEPALIDPQNSKSMNGK